MNPTGTAPSPELADREVVIGPMRRRHLRGVLRIEQQVYPRPWSMGLFMSELASGASRVYVTARIGSSVVGYGGLMLVPDDGHITTLAVDPAWHRHRIGTRVLHTLTAAGIARGAKNLTLEVRVGNEPAQGLYRAFGFAPAGIRKGYYAESNEDALIMWANDIDTPEYAERLAGLADALPTPTVVERLDR
ncbi:MAG: ribosomal protein S18-alanine N-acetyltransferase [Acidimicrobiales bacterium]